ncbi:MAG: CCA tRNA nucleotidyltransferase, partial [Spirochaetota bacterium]
MKAILQSAEGRTIRNEDTTGLKPVVLHIGVLTISIMPVFTQAVAVPPILKEIAKIFLKAGFQCFLVGGALRNLYTSQPVTDYDLATDALPEQVTGLFKKVIPTGIRHGTVTVLYKGHKFEVTTFRIDGDYSDFRRPDKIAYTPSIFEDLKRRDFTINSMAFNLENYTLLDPHNGINDIKKKVIKAIGDPYERFNEDGLRILRACRLAAQLNFSIEENTFKAIKDNVSQLQLVSAERLRDEITKILECEKPSIGFEIMERANLLQFILPELQACKGVQQKGFHKFDVYTHSLLTCDFTPADLVLRLSALLHDIGKPEALSFSSSGEPLFYRHEEISARMAHTILRRLKFPKAVE